MQTKAGMKGFHHLFVSLQRLKLKSMHRLFQYLTSPRAFLWLLFFLLTGGEVLAQTYRYDTGFTLSKQHFCDTIPLDMVDGRPLLTVTMNGRKHKVLLDTGSSQGVVFSEKLPSGLSELGSVVARDGNLRKDTVRVVQLPRFSMGSISIDGYVATVHRRLVASKMYDFIVGFDIFNKGISAKIDARNRRLIITDNKQRFANEAGYKLKYKLKWFVPYLIVSPFIRHADECSFDTGFMGLYSMNKDHFDKHAYKSKNVGSQVEAVVEGQGYISAFGVEQHTEVAFMHLNRLQFDRFEFRNVKARTSYGPSKLGSELLNYGTFLILPHQKRIVFQPYNGGEYVEVNNKLKQMAFVPSGGRAMVGLVNPQSEAYKKGFRQGDIVLEIDHRPVGSFQAFVNYPFVDGQVYVFTLQTADGQRKEIRSVR